MRVRLTATALECLAGSQAWADVDRGLPDVEVDGGDRHAGALMRRLIEAPRRRDGSVTVELSRLELEILMEYATTWRDVACDDIGGWGEPTQGLGELNSARALVRNLAKAMLDQSAPSL